MRTRDKIATAAEVFGAVLIGVGFWLWSPAISLIWFGGLVVVIAWSMTAESRQSNGNTDTESN